VQHLLGILGYIWICGFCSVGNFFYLFVGTFAFISIQTYHRAQLPTLVSQHYICRPAETFVQHCVSAAVSRLEVFCDSVFTLNTRTGGVAGLGLPPCFLHFLKIFCF
jgi:hypothetical protein